MQALLQNWGYVRDILTGFISLPEYDGYECMFVTLYFYLPYKFINII